MFTTQKLHELLPLKKAQSQQPRECLSYKEEVAGTLREAALRLQILSGLSNYGSVA